MKAPFSDERRRASVWASRKLTFLFTILPAPYFKKHGKRPGVVAFVDGATAAAVGTIAGAVVVLGRRSVIDLPTLALALGAAFVLWRFKKVPEPVVIVVAVAVGMIVHPLMTQV